MTAEEVSFGDDGLTLVELIIYMLLAAMILTVVSSIFINGLLSQASTTDRDAATARANAVTASLQQSVRNSTGVRAPNSNTLVATVATSNASLPECRAWVISGGAVKYKATTYSGAMSTTPDATWVTLATGAAASGTVAFTAPSVSEATYALTFKQGTSSVPVYGDIVAQGYQGAGSPQC